MRSAGRSRGSVNHLHRHAVGVVLRGVGVPHARCRVPIASSDAPRPPAQGVCSPRRAPLRPRPAVGHRRRRARRRRSPRAPSPRRHRCRPPRRPRSPARCSVTTGRGAVRSNDHSHDSRAQKCLNASSQRGRGRSRRSAGTRYPRPPCRTCRVDHRPASPAAGGSTPPQPEQRSRSLSSSIVVPFAGVSAVCSPPRQRSTPRLTRASRRRRPGSPHFSHARRRESGAAEVASASIAAIHASRRAVTSAKVGSRRASRRRSLTPSIARHHRQHGQAPRRRSLPAPLAGCDS